MTKFPGYRIRIMNDYWGNMNEIVSLENTPTTDEENEHNHLYLTIEEACEYQKNHPNKIFALWDYDPEEVVEYVKNSGAKYIDD